MAGSLVTQFENFTFNYEDPGINFQDVVECDPGSPVSIMLLSLDICNTSNAGITCDIVLYDASKDEDFYLGKQTPIPVGSTLQCIVKQKHILMPGDKIKIKPNTYNVAGTLSVIGASMKMSMSI